jgi:hypothetical protein
MLLVDDLLASPVNGLIWVFREIHKAATTEQATRRENIMAALSALYVSLEQEEITEEEFDTQEQALLDELDAYDARADAEEDEDDEDDEDDDDDDEDPDVEDPDDGNPDDGDLDDANENGNAPDIRSMMSAVGPAPEPSENAGSLNPGSVVQESASTEKTSS